MKPKPDSDHELSFRRLSALNGSTQQVRKETVQPSVQKPAQTSRQTDEARRNLYRQATQYLSTVMSAVRAGQPFSLEPGYAILQRIVDIHSPMDALFLKAIHSDDSYDFVVNHSVNVAIYATKMAETLGYVRERQIEMGMVGLFHDIGMARIPEEIIYKKDKLNDREFHLIKERPKLGYEILRQFGDDYAYLAECTLQIYERVDGSGYPRGLKEDEIHEYAQLIGLVDMYEALIHTRPQREKILHYYAVKEIIRSGKRQFQQKHLKTLLNTFSIFPLQSYVKLNSNAIGRVIQTYRDQPMRPKLQIVYDSQRKRVLTERTINLPEHSLLYITDAVSEEDLLALSEESYLLTKPAGFEESAGAEDPDESPEALKPASKPAGPIGPKNKPKDGKSAFSRLDRWRKWLLAGAVLLIVGGGAWQLMGSSRMAAVPGAPQKTQVALPASRPMGTQPPSAAPAVGEIPEAEMAPAGELTQPPTTPEAETPVAVISAAEQTAPEAAGAAGPVIGAPEAPAVPPAQWVVSPPPPAAAFPFSIKLAHFRTQAEADDAAAAFRTSGIDDAHWVRVDLGDQGVWYRVFGGHFKTGGEAEAEVARSGAPGAVAKSTAYANWIGASEDAAVVQEKAEAISDLGFSPYTIRHGDGKYHLFVGAFYTRAGAAAQALDLDAKGIQNQIVER